jgi:hypothetical protein
MQSPSQGALKNLHVLLVASGTGLCKVLNALPVAPQHHLKNWEFNVKPA